MKETIMPKPDESVCPNWENWGKKGGEERRELGISRGETEIDNRLANIMSLINGNDLLKSEEDSFALAEKVILRWDPSLEGSWRSLNWEDSGDEADEYLLTIDEILNLMDELSVRSDSEIVNQAYSTIQHAMSRLEGEFFVLIFLPRFDLAVSLSGFLFYFIFFYKLIFK